MSKGPPDAPKKPVLISASSTSVSIRWDVPNNNGKKIIKYEVEVRKSNKEKIGTWSTIDNEITINSLKGYNFYEFRVAAINSNGCSNFSEVFQFKTTTGTLALL